MIDKHNYLNKNIKYVKTIIREYDMKNAGLSIIKKMKLLDDETIKYLESINKQARNIYVGKLMQNDTDLSINLLSGFKEARQLFFTNNNIEDENILSIKKDAIFTLNKLATNLKFDGYEFVMKNIYSSYIYLNKLEFYYNSKENKLDIKGINKDIISTHQDYFLKDIKLILKNMETPKNNLSFINNYRNKYLNKSLPIECYREFNKNNLYKLIYDIDNRTVNLESCESFESLDISYNYINYILPIINVII